MGKRRKAGKKSRGGAEDGAAGSNNSKFSAFEFNADDSRVEDESRKTLAKFGARSPSKKPVHRRKSIDKYDFLECFAKGITSKQKHFVNDELDIDATDGVIQDRTFGTGVGMSFGSLNHEPVTPSSLECQSSECTFGVKSCLTRRRKPGCHTAGKKHNQVLHLDSDEDERLELGSLSSSINMGEIEGSLKEQSSEYGANSNDCEAVVVVAPYYVKHGKNYYRRCRLTFSQRCIRLEASPLCDRKRTFCVEWPTSDILNIAHEQCESDNAEVINLYLRYKDANARETGTPNLGSEELEFVILDDPQWSEKQEEIKSLDLKYKASWKTSLTECCFEESFEELVYPDGDPDAVIISRRDIELLQPRTFINDTIIDFYIRFLLNKTKEVEQHRFHFFNTFFFQKLVAVRRELSRGCRGKAAFQSVRKWTRNVNLFDKDYILIPVNFSLHWSLIIICHPGEVANLRNKDMGESSKVPCILHMDSIRGSHRGFEKLIRSYLWEEWRERGNEQEEEIAAKFLHLDFVSLQLPQQENFFDCGLFLLHYAELFLELASNCSTIKYIDFLNEDWFLPAEVSLKKRDHIRKLIHRLIQDNALKDPPAASNNDYLQKLGRDVGDSSTRSVLQNGGRELCGRINFNLTDDLDSPDQQCYAPMVKQRNIGKSTTKECYQPLKLPVPIHQFNKLSLPMEEAIAGQKNVLQRDTGSRYKTNELMPPRCQLDLFLAGEISKTCSDESAVILAEENEEDCVPEVAFPTETQNNGDENSLMRSEDLAACVVEDSEEESEGESIQRTRRYLFPNRTFDVIV